MREKTVMNVLITQTRPHGIIRVATVLLIVCFLAENVFALGGYWKPIEGKSYTVRFTDEAKNVVLGEFKKTVRWEWDKKGNVTITKWDDEGATFMFKDKEGKEHKIHNATIKVRILDLAPGFSGKLKGNIKDALYAQRQISQSVTVHLCGVKSWSPPEQQWTLLEGIINRSFSFNYWKLDNIHLANRSGLMMIDEGGRVRVKTIKTGSEFSRKVVKVLQPKGKFVEVLLIFTNVGKEPVEERLSQLEGSKLDIRMVLPDDKRDVFSTDFQVPGVAGCRLANCKELHKKGLTVVSELNLKPGGWLGIELAPKDETYILLLFDVPKKANSAMLMIKTAEPVKLEFSHVVANRFVDRHDGTLTDTESNLMWLAECKKTAKNTNEAKKICSELDNGGHKDWRLPTSKELLELVSFAKTNNLPIDLKRGKRSRFWTSTEFKQDASKQGGFIIESKSTPMEMVTSDGGTIIWGGADTEGDFILPVRKTDSNVDTLHDALWKGDVAKATTVFGYVITETLNMTMEPNLPSPAIGTPLKYGDKCKVLSRTKHSVQVRPIKQANTVGWIPDWLLASQPLGATKGFSNLLRFVVSDTNDIIAIDSHSSAEIGLSQSSRELTDKSEATPRLRKRFFDPTGKTAVSSDIPFGKYTFDPSTGSLSIYLDTNVQYVFEITGGAKPTYSIAGKPFQPEHGCVYEVRKNRLERSMCIPGFEFLRTQQHISASSTNEVSSGIMGLPQFFIRMETE